MVLLVSSSSADDEIELISSDNAINTNNGLGYATTADKCNRACGGDSTQNCGAYWTNAMYMVTSKYQAAQARFVCRIGT